MCIYVYIPVSHVLLAVQMNEQNIHPSFSRQFIQVSSGALKCLKKYFFYLLLYEHSLRYRLMTHVMSYVLVLCVHASCMKYLCISPVAAT